MEKQISRFLYENYMPIRKGYEKTGEHATHLHRRLHKDIQKVITHTLSRARESGGVRVRVTVRSI